MKSFFAIVLLTVAVTSVSQARELSPVETASGSVERYLIENNISVVQPSLALVKKCDMFEGQTSHGSSLKVMCLRAISVNPSVTATQIDSTFRMIDIKNDNRVTASMLSSLVYLDNPLLKEYQAVLKN